MFHLIEQQLSLLESTTSITPRIYIFQISKLDMSETQDVTDFDSTEDFVSDDDASLNDSDSFNISDYSDE